MERSRKKLDVFHIVQLTDGNRNIANELFCLNKNPSATAFNNSLSRPACRSNWHYVLSLPGREDTEAALRSLWLPLLFSPDHSGVSWGAWHCFQGSGRCWVCVSVCLCVGEDQSVTTGSSFQLTFTESILSALLAGLYGISFMPCWLFLFWNQTRMHTELCYLSAR